MIIYTTHGHKLGFGPTRKLPGFNDRKRVNIKNMDPFAIVESRGIGAVQISSLWPIVVYSFLPLTVCMLSQVSAEQFEEQLAQSATPMKYDSRQMASEMMVNT